MQPIRLERFRAHGTDTYRNLYPIFRTQVLHGRQVLNKKRKQSKAATKQREYEEMENTIRLMVHILMQEKKTIRKQGEPDETKYDEPILATYERWDALTDRMNDMGLLTTC